MLPRAWGHFIPVSCRIAICGMAPERIQQDSRRKDGLSIDSIFLSLFMANVLQYLLTQLTNGLAHLP